MDRLSHLVKSQFCFRLVRPSPPPLLRISLISDLVPQYIVGQEFPEEESTSSPPSSPDLISSTSHRVWERSIVQTGLLTKGKNPSNIAESFPLTETLTQRRRRMIMIITMIAITITKVLFITVMVKMMMIMIIKEIPPSHF